MPATALYTIILICMWTPVQSGHLPEPRATGAHESRTLLHLKWYRSSAALEVHCRTGYTQVRYTGGGGGGVGRSVRTLLLLY